MTDEQVVPDAPAILGWPSLTSSNPFPAKMSGSLSGHGMKVREFSLKEGLVGQFDLLLMHWPERVIERSSSIESIMRLAALACVVQRCRFRKTPIVWVAHNLRSHDQVHPRLERVLRSLVDPFIDGVVHLSEHSRLAMADHRPLLRPSIEIVVRHGQDTSFPPEGGGPKVSGLKPRRLKLLAFGVVRPYKRLPEMVHLVSDVADHLGASLLVAGPTGDEVEAIRLAAAVESSDAVQLDNRHIPESELDELLWQSDGVVVAHGSFLNSGTIIHALSRGTPVLAPAVGSVPEIVKDVGPNWVFVYEPPLTAASLGEGIEWLRGRDEAAEHPDISRYEWGVAGDAVAALLRTVLNDGGATS